MNSDLIAWTLRSEFLLRDGKPVPQAEVVLLPKTTSAYMDVPGKFRRYVKRDNVQAFDPIGGTTPWVQGAGKGNLIVSNIPMSETAAESPNGIAVGDYAVLDDPDPVWGAARGQILGEIVKIQPLPNVRLIAEITLKHKLDFATLREVMVMNKQ